WAGAERETTDPGHRAGRLAIRIFHRAVGSWSGPGVHYHAAPDRGHGRVRPDDSPVPPPRHQRFFEAQPGDAALAGGDLGPCRRDPCEHLRGPEVEPEPGALGDSPGCVRQEREAYVDGTGCPPRRVAYGNAPPPRFGAFDPGQS